MKRDPRRARLDTHPGSGQFTAHSRAPTRSDGRIFVLPDTATSWKLAGLPTAEEVAFYRENGYLKFGRLFTEEEMADLSRYLDKLLEELPPGKRPESLDVPHFEHPYLFRFLLHPRVLDAIEALVGPHITLWSSHFISKPRGDGLAVPWHTDGDYWGARLEPMEVATMWLAVDPSNQSNGCMRVVPGSHQWGGGLKYKPVDKTTNVFDEEIEEGTFDESQVVDLEIEKGECHFHDAYTVHGSLPNHSDRRRCGYTMRYMPAHVVFHPLGPHDQHRVYLARGRDLTGGKTIYSETPRW